MHVILSSSAVWVTAKDAEVIVKVRTASMMARKSRVDIVIYCGGGAEVLGPATSLGALVLGGPRALEVQRTQERWVMEQEVRMQELDAPQYALLEVVAPLQEGRLLAGPRLDPEA